MYVSKSNLVSVPVKDSAGHEYGRMYFIPGDIAIHIRATEVQKKLMSFFDPLSGLAILSDGRGADIHSSVVIADLTESFEAMVDIVCGTETSTEVFKEMHPFASMPDGRFYAEAVIEALCDVDAVVLANLRTINQQIKKEINMPKWRKR